VSLTPNGAYFEELGGSPTLEINTQGISAMRKFWIPKTADLTAFVQEVMGVWVMQGNSPTGTCFFQPPMSYPGFGNVVPSDIKVVPHMPDSPMGTFPVGVTLNGPANDYSGGWDVTVEYTTQYNVNPWASFQPAVPNGTYLSYSADLGAETMIIPGRAVSWGQYVDGVPELLVDASGQDMIVKADVEVGIQRPTGNYTLTWDRVLEPPWAAIRLTRGHVNATTFMGAPPMCVLFLGAQVSRQFQFTDDGGFWKVEYKFAENSVTLNSGTEVSGWNYKFNPDMVNDENWTPLFTYSMTSPGDPGFISNSGTLTGYTPPSYQVGEPLYPSGDFDALFEFDSNFQC
jgi:hypothetical protein